MAEHRHILLVSFPSQGHINPALEFAKRLIRLGVNVTLATTISARRRMSQTLTLDGLSYATFSDNYDDGFKPGDNIDDFMSQLDRRGSETLTDLISSSASEGRRFSFIFYTILIQWVAEVARAFHIPSAFLWIQPATLLDIYYFYFNGYGDAIRKNNNDPSWSIQLPGLPLLKVRDLPSFFSPSHTYNFALPRFQRHFELLDEESDAKLLINTFEELEHNALKAFDKYNLIPIGPLIPSAFLDGKDPTDTSFGGDLFEGSKDYLEWLNSKPKSSVIYVSFGSITSLSEKQMEEIGKGILKSNRPFLWVIRRKANGEEEKLSCKEELEREGKIVGWCSQVEVLNNPAIGCFITHFGWNSTLESLSSGIPMVGLPQWSDQNTNAKLVEDEWKIGVRVRENEEGIVEGEEICKCLDLVMGDGERSQEIRRNAKKLSGLAKEAAREGGSSDKNLKSFVDQL